MLRVFVDGAAGTVGAALQPHLEKLQAEGLIELVTVAEALRKDLEARQDAFSLSDVVVLCLPDAEAGAAAALVEAVNPGARILDASATHRCNEDWVYGFPEVTSAQAITAARRVANPGCFASACILAGKPLVDAFGVSHLQFQGITGYSAGGRKANPDDMPRLVQFGREHRHLPEIARYTGAVPVLTTTVGPWKQGMLVQTFVPYAEDQVLRAFEEAYQGIQGIRVAGAQALNYRVDPQACNGTNDVLVCVAGQAGGGTSVAVVLDNLGKGSAGAAAANLRLMAGIG
jgi:N-acetyl-gamma-glutamyl-phosphate reductase